jgi:GNAT superfamily N-acetyltransferase
MAELRYVRVDGDLAAAEWRRVHNAVIPTAPLSLDEVSGNASLRVMEVAYADDVVVGNSTVRPPTDDEPATVIVRVLSEHRRQGYGAALFGRALEQGREIGGSSSSSVQTVVLESNVDGLRFALAHGFVEVERYLLDGDTIPFITLRRR